MVVKCAVYCHCPLFSLMSETKNTTTVVNFVFRSPFSVLLVYKVSSRHWQRAASLPDINKIKVVCACVSGGLWVKIPYSVPVGSLTREAFS